MIVSHKHKFIFIKTRKTAGSSIEIALRSICGDKDIITPIWEDNYLEGIGKSQNYEGRFSEHAAASAVQSKIPNAWKKYFTFCFERNPWDKVISFYYWNRRHLHVRLKYETLSKFIQSTQWRGVINYRYYANRRTGEVLVDKIYKYEELESALKDISNRFNLPKLNLIKTKHLCRTDRRPYTDVLTEPEAKRIHKYFKYEIDLMGYKYHQD